MRLETKTVVLRTPSLSKTGNSHSSRRETPSTECIRRQSAVCSLFYFFVTLNCDILTPKSKAFIYDAYGINVVGFGRNL